MRGCGCAGACIHGCLQLGATVKLGTRRSPSFLRNGGAQPDQLCQRLGPVWQTGCTCSSDALLCFSLHDRHPTGPGTVGSSSQSTHLPLWERDEFDPGCQIPGQHRAPSRVERLFTVTSFATPTEECAAARTRLEAQYAVDLEAFHVRAPQPQRPKNWGGESRDPNRPTSVALINNARLPSRERNGKQCVPS